MKKNSPEILFQRADELEKTNNYLLAIKFYEQAQTAYLTETEKKIFAVRCMAKITINKIRASSFGITETTEDEPAKEILNHMEQELDNLAHMHFDDPNLHLPFLRYRILIYRDLENFLLNQGLKNESIKMYVKYMSLERQRLKFIRRKAHWRPFKYKFISLAKETGLFISSLFGYWVELKNLLISTFVLWGFFGLTFHVFDLIEYTDSLKTNEKPTLAESFYFSTVTLTSIGTEALMPKADGYGRVVECIEAVFGLVLLGMLVAYFSKRIR